MKEKKDSSLDKRFRVARPSINFESVPALDCEMHRWIVTKDRFRETKSLEKVTRMFRRQIHGSRQRDTSIYRVTKFSPSAVTLIDHFSITVRYNCRVFSLRDIKSRRTTLRAIVCIYSRYRYKHERGESSVLSSPLPPPPPPRMCLPSRQSAFG